MNIDLSKDELKILNTTLNYFLGNKQTLLFSNDEDFQNYLKLKNKITTAIKVKL